MATYFKTGPDNLCDLLHSAADRGDNGLAFFSPGNIDHISKRVTYRDLLQQARKNACLLPHVEGIQKNSVILLHFNNHQDGFEWLWSSIVSGYLPAISTPFTNDPELRKKHIKHLQTLLHDPVILTSEALLHEFEGVDGLNIQTIEKIRLFKTYLRGQTNGHTSGEWVYGGEKKAAEDLAVLMLTSGSTGNAKAVGLRHGQILTSIAGKSEHHGTTADDTFLNWIGLDHVANLTETHLHAMYLGAEQIHVQAADLLPDPLRFLTLISKLRVAHSFAPNFFIASMRNALEAPNAFEKGKEPDLSCFRILISGGEANVVETSSTFTRLLAPYNIPGEIVRPGFGMTETCAGSIYSRACPSYDLISGLEFTSLGTCIPGLKMRVTNDDGETVGSSETGNLELSGPILFKEYYNNPTATAESFTADGWFKTGDRAMIDANGWLNLTGRAKESIIINGVKYFPHELETAIETAEIKGVSPSYTAVFPHRPRGSQTEVICVVYVPTYDPEDAQARVQVTDSISKVSIMQCGVKPYHIIPLTTSLLPKSSLGKLSRAKIRTAYEAGEYSTLQADNDSIIREYRASTREAPSSKTEAQLLAIFAKQFNLDELEIGMNTSLFEMGVSSIEIIQLKTLIQRELKLETEIPVITMMTNPTVRGLSGALSKLQEEHVYSPVVVLQSQGDKTPLFLIHPGVGEVLVFLNLAKYIVDRPVYAIRARGFDGEEFFNDIPEVISTYHKAIKEVQPNGPYALAGYSYGSMIAFEISKVLESKGDEVAFLGVFNLPPHIKFRMRQLDWTEVILNLAYFLDLMTEEYAHEISPEMHKLEHEQVLDFIISKAPPTRMVEMALDKKKLATWADLAYRMQAIAQDYDPSGKVGVMDIFYAIPLSAVAKTKGEWKEKHLSKWSEFVQTPPQFHEVEGAHYTMISPLHVFTFQKTLRSIMEQRGI
jgi:acyl-CoA synthetase (AMP-forming)/AMP-acid ligase II/thioesterase domain-containing protein